MDRYALIAALSNGDKWVDAKTLAAMLHVSTRTIRNWVSKENAGRERPTILSGRLGYRLADHAAAAEDIPTGHVSHADQLLSLLLGAHDCISIYDAADQLHLSDSACVALLREVREEAERYGLSLARTRDLMWLEGGEAEKRRLINVVIARQHPQGFSVLMGVGADETEGRQVSKDIASALQRHGLEYNEFGLSSIAVHVVTMVRRIRSGHALEEPVASDYPENVCVKQAAQDIYAACEQRFHIPRFSDEVGYLCLTVELNSKASGWRAEEGVTRPSFVSDWEWAATRRAVHELEVAYHLEPFDEEFLIRLSAHVHCLHLRAVAGSFTSNPLARKTKASYPLFYDMAVCLADRLMTHLDIGLTEDEIGFLAFHIGGYFEAHASADGRISTTLLTAEYLDFDRGLKKIEQRLGDRIAVVEQLPFSAVEHGARVLGELVVSPFPVPVESWQTLVNVNLLLGDEDVKAIEEAVRGIQEGRRRDRALRLLSGLLRPDMFWRNLYAADRQELIRLMVDPAVADGLCGPDYLESVLRREEISSTAFDGLVAVPHPMEPLARRSFLSIVVNDRPTKWGDQSVNLVMLIGLSQCDQRQMWSLFEDVLGVLSDQRKVVSLLESAGYEDFLLRLHRLMERTE